MLIRCPHCEYARTIGATKIPPTAEVATCPKCKSRFRFRTLEPDEKPHRKEPEAPKEKAPADIWEAVDAISRTTPQPAAPRGQTAPPPHENDRRRRRTTPLEQSGQTPRRRHDDPLELLPPAREPRRRREDTLVPEEPRRRRDDRHEPPGQPPYYDEDAAGEADREREARLALIAAERAKRNERPAGAEDAARGPNIFAKGAAAATAAATSAFRKPMAWALERLAAMQEKAAEKSRTAEHLPLAGESSELTPLVVERSAHPAAAPAIVAAPGRHPAGAPDVPASPPPPAHPAPFSEEPPTPEEHWERPAGAVRADARIQTLGPERTAEREYKPGPEQVLESDVFAAPEQAPEPEHAPGLERIVEPEHTPGPAAEAPVGHEESPAPDRIFDDLVETGQQLQPTPESDELDEAVHEAAPAEEPTVLPQMEVHAPNGAEPALPVEIQAPAGAEPTPEPPRAPVPPVRSTPPAHSDEPGVFPYGGTDSASPEERVARDMLLLRKEEERPIRDLGHIDLWTPTEEEEAEARHTDIPWENQEVHGRFGGFAGTVRHVLLRPTAFFSGLPPFGSLAPAYLFFIIQSYIALLCTLLWRLAVSAVLNDDAMFPPGRLGLPILLLLTPLFMGLMLMFCTGVIRAFLRIMAPELADFPASFKVTCYAASAFVFCIIPLIGPAVAWIWFGTAMICGFRHSLGLSWPMAVLTALLPAVLLPGSIIALFF